MKAAVIGYSGSGKSTLAKLISDKNKIPALFLDCVHWLPGWKERSNEEKYEIVKEFMEQNDSWVIDGNYSKTLFHERMEEADEIIFMNFNRFSCLYRAIKRYLKYRGKSRFSMTEGCAEKIDWEFIRWIMHDGRTHNQKERYANVIRTYHGKVTVIRNQKELSEYIKEQLYDGLRNIE